MFMICRMSRVSILLILLMLNSCKNKDTSPEGAAAVDTTSTIDPIRKETITDTPIKDFGTLVLVLDSLGTQATQQG